MVVRKFKSRNLYGETPKEERKRLINYFLGILIGCLFVFSGLYLCINFADRDFIFGIGMLGNMFGGYIIFKMLFEYKLS